MWEERILSTLLKLYNTWYMDKHIFTQKVLKTIPFRKQSSGTSLVVQRLRFYVSTAEGTGSIPGLGSSTWCTVQSKK